MSTEYETRETLDAVLEVVATDPGSTSDIEGWANSTSDAGLLDQIEGEEGGEPVYRHYIRRTGE
ncbi:MAG: SirA family protein [Haloarculaceae archaeon]